MRGLISVIVILLLSMTAAVSQGQPGKQPSPSPTVSPTPEETPAEDNEVLRIDTEEISLNVRVIDSRNRSVGNLDKSQFLIYEDDVLQPITSLATAQVPVVSAIVVDNSRSLRAQLAKIIDAGKTLVGSGRPKDETAVVRFVSSDKIELLRDFTSNTALLNDALDNLFVEGGQTAIIDAVYRTAKKVDEYQNSQKKDDPRRRSLIVVSDGDDRGSEWRESDLFALLRKLDVQVYAIGFVNNLSDKPEAEEPLSRRERARAFLDKLAAETGGKAYFPNSADELPRIAADISSDLHTQYLLTYAPTSENRKGRFYKLRVEIRDGPNKEKRSAVTRSGRVAGGDESPTPPNRTRKPED